MGKAWTEKTDHEFTRTLRDMQYVSAMCMSITATTGVVFINQFDDEASVTLNANRDKWIAKVNVKNDDGEEYESKMFALLSIYRQGYHFIKEVLA